MSVSFWMNPMAHFSALMIPQNADLAYCQLSLFIGDYSHNLKYYLIKFAWTIQVVSSTLRATTRG